MAILTSQKAMPREFVEEKTHFSNKMIWFCQLLSALCMSATDGTINGDILHRVVKIKY